MTAVKALEMSMSELGLSYIYSSSMTFPILIERILSRRVRFTYTILVRREDYILPKHTYFIHVILKSNAIIFIIRTN